jgi:hypothetical protein
MRTHVTIEVVKKDKIGKHDVQYSYGFDGYRNTLKLTSFIIDCKYLQDRKGYRNSDWTSAIFLSKETCTNMFTSHPAYYNLKYTLPSLKKYTKLSDVSVPADVKAAALKRLRKFI